MKLNWVLTQSNKSPIGSLPRAYSKHRTMRLCEPVWQRGRSGGQYGVAESPEEVGKDGNMADSWYSTDGQYWTEVEAPWPIRHACAVHVHRGELFLAAGNAMYYPDDEVQHAVADVMYQPKGKWLPGDVWKLRRAKRPAL